MAETSQATLRLLLASSYEEFKMRLSRRLGSDDFANEVLHETYLRVARSAEQRSDFGERFTTGDHLGSRGASGPGREL